MTSKEVEKMKNEEVLEILLGNVDYKDYSSETMRLVNSCVSRLWEILERLETLENKNAALKIKVRAWEIQGEKYKQENEKLKNALAEACKMLSWDCPCGQDLIDDLDCENRCQPDIDYSECWLKYFIKEVLGDA